MIPDNGDSTATALRGNAEVAEALGRRYAAGFVTDIETDSLPPGLSEDVIRQLSARKGVWRRLWPVTPRRSPKPRNFLVLSTPW